MDKKIISKVDLERAGRIRNMRNNQNLTQEKMAEKMDISIASYQRLESGRNNITLEYLTKFKEEFGISSDYILFGEPKSKDDLELELNKMDDREKLAFVIRILGYLSNIKNIDYEKLLADADKYLK